MTKKILAVLLAVSLVLTCGLFAMAEDTSSNTSSDTSSETKIEVVFDANSGEGTMETIEVVDGAVTVPQCSMTKNLFVFDGWNTAADGSGDKYQPGDVLKTDVSVTLFAQWKSENAENQAEYIITYKANGGEGEDVVDDFGYFEGMEAMAAFCEFTYEGREFKEWNTKADGTGTAYAEFDTIVIGNSDLVLYAIWTGGEDDSKVEEPSDIVDPKPVDPVDPVDPETATDTDSENPETGDAATTAIALGAGIAALGALVVLKKKN
ncbi:MAG: InlB B-repeat-containing protein [Clostridia bacterium]|nr:InlB B-repeat-containing protein [Clostridia bacterium]